MKTHSLLDPNILPPKLPLVRISWWRTFHHLSFLHLATYVASHTPKVIFLHNIALTIILCLLHLDIILSIHLVLECEITYLLVFTLLPILQCFSCTSKMIMGRWQVVDTKSLSILLLDHRENEFDNYDYFGYVSLYFIRIIFPYLTHKKTREGCQNVASLICNSSQD